MVAAAGVAPATAPAVPPYMAKRFGAHDTLLLLLPVLP